MYTKNINCIRKGKCFNLLKKKKKTLISTHTRINLFQLHYAANLLIEAHMQKG